jgi:large subunit ribosomal protein L25
MELKIFKRASTKKSETKKIRRENDIPMVVYSRKEEASNYFIKGSDFSKIMAKIDKGMLSTTIFTLDSDGKKKKAIVKGIQYNKTNYAIIHLDFLILDEESNVTINIPVECVGMEACNGITLGGILRQVIRAVRVSCLPKDIPNKFVIDVSSLNITESKKLKEITMPSGVRPITDVNQVVVSIAKR